MFQHNRGYRMFIVLKSFAGKDYSGTKGKTINIDNKKLSNSLKEAGYIAEYSKEQQTNDSKDKEIVELKATISDLTQKVENLENEKQDLLNQIESLTNSDNDSKQTGENPDNNEVIDAEKEISQNADGENSDNNEVTNEKTGENLKVDSEPVNKKATDKTTDASNKK